MRIAPLFILFFGFWVSFQQAPVAAETPFRPGELLRYEVRWAGIPVGRATLSVVFDDSNGRAVYRVNSRAESNDIISVFFPVKDLVESVIDAETLLPYRLSVQQRHGRRKVKKHIEFDQESHVATLSEKGKKIEFDVPPGVQDVLSSLYYIRSLETLLPGDSVFIDVHESKKNWRTEVRFEKREEIQLPAGKFKTVKVRALIRYEGLLMNKGDAFVWLSDDERRIPVQMEGKISIGSITTVLESIERPFLLNPPAP